MPSIAPHFPCHYYHPLLPSSTRSKKHLGRAHVEHLFDELNCGQVLHTVEDPPAGGARRVISQVVAYHVASTSDFRGVPDGEVVRIGMPWPSRWQISSAGERYR